MAEPDAADAELATEVLEEAAEPVPAATPAVALVWLPIVTVALEAEPVPVAAPEPTETLPDAPALADDPDPDPELDAIDALALPLDPVPLAAPAGVPDVPPATSKIPESKMPPSKMPVPPGAGMVALAAAPVPDEAPAPGLMLVDAIELDPDPLARPAADAVPVATPASEADPVPDPKPELAAIDA